LPGCGSTGLVGGPAALWSDEPSGGILYRRNSTM